MENKKLNFAFMSAYSGDVHRGAETFVHELSNCLASSGHTVSVYQNGSKLADSKYKTVSLGITSKLFFMPLFIFKTLGMLSSDVQIVVPINGRLQVFLTKLWCVLHKKKMVVSGQSGPGFDDRFNILCFPDYFIAISRVGLQKAKTDNPFVKSAFIPNGADTKKFFSGRSGLKTSLTSPIVLCVGALVEKKRIDLVINAVSKIPNISLLVVGSGSLREKLMKLAEKKLHNRYQFLQVSHDKMPDIYRLANLFTLVSDSSEAFGIVYAEAMATNLPLVVRDDTIRRDIIQQAGLYVKNPESEAEYAKAIKEALNRNWGNIPRMRSKEFDWQTISKKYEEIFLSL